MLRFLCLIGLLLTPISGHCADVTMCASGCDYANIQAAFAGMSGGDTLTISAGTYTGATNNIDSAHIPPSGSVGAYTTIQGSGPGEVQFENTTSTDGGTPVALSYVIFKNIEWTGTANGPTFTGTSHTDRTLHHIKFLQCGSTYQFWTSNSSYILFEDCYVAKNCNYNFGALSSDHVVFRRCVARKDATGGVMPMAHFISYGIQNAEFQNCILIDSDSTTYVNENANLMGGIYIRHTYTEVTPNEDSTDNAIRGCISLNVKHKTWPGGSNGIGWSVGSGATGLVVENSIWWDQLNGYVPDQHGLTGTTLSHCTFGESVHNADYAWNSSFFGADPDSTAQGIVTNSIAVGAGDYAFYNLESYNYNAFYDNSAGNAHAGTDGGNNITDVNPLTSHLRYLPRIESVSGLDASDSGKIGATITKRIGSSETLHGETGYATTTDTNLWPWPNESVIRAFFIEQGAVSPDPNRGFCAAGQTLTKYIWEYLGNTIPCEVYGTCNSPRMSGGVLGGVSR